MVTRTKAKKPAKKNLKQKPNPKHVRPRKTAVSGCIRADEVLTVDAFCARLVCKISSVAEMRKRGLIVRQDGANRIRIHGQDYLNYVASLPPAPLWGGMDVGETAGTTDATKHHRDRLPCTPDSPSPITTSSPS